MEVFYKNILIISDNFFLCKEFIAIFKKKFKETISVNLAISPSSIYDDFKDIANSELRIFNMKNTNHIKMIISKYDLVFSIHCKQLFPKELVESLKCINIHPGYNPENRGWYPQVFSIIHKNILGATIHEMDEFLDNGNIIDREIVSQKSYDTSGELYNRVLQKELELIERNLEAILTNTYKVMVPEGEGKMYLKKDFRDLCKLDLNEQITMGEAINRLRALTHFQYKNAYYIDEIEGKKVYVSVHMEAIDFDK